MFLAFKYAVFAVIATIINIVSQDAALSIYSGPLSLYVSIFAGTLNGLVAKYILDKKYIFSYRTRDLADDGRKFLLYSFMGVFTTLIFWGTELGFEFVFRTKTMRYLGGIIGLTIGYISKYQLDKRFVFIPSPRTKT